MMKSKCLVVLGAVAIGITMTYAVIAQQASTSQPSSVRPVALLDVEYLMGQDATFEVGMRQVEEKYSKLLQESQSGQQEIAQLQDLLGTYERGSEKYRETERLVAAKGSDLTSRQMLLYKEMTEERLRVINSSYNRVMKQVDRVATYYGMQIVLNYRPFKTLDKLPMTNNAQKYDSVVQQYVMSMGLNTVVWSNQKSVDITQIVLKEIQKAEPNTIRKTDNTAAAKPAAAAAAVGTQARP